MVNPSSMVVTCLDMRPVFCACALLSPPSRRRSRLCWHLGSSFLSCSRTKASHRIVSDLYTLPCAGPHFLAWILTPLVHGSSVLHLGLLRVRHVRVKDRTLCGRFDVKFSECSISRRPCITDSLARGFSCAVNPFLFCRATTEDGFQQVLLPAEPEGDWCNLVSLGRRGMRSRRFSIFISLFWLQNPPCLFDREVLAYVVSVAGRPARCWRVSPCHRLRTSRT